MPCTEEERRGKKLTGLFPAGFFLYISAEEC